MTVERTPSFIDGMGSTRVLDAMWPLLERLIDDVVVVSRGGGGGGDPPAGGRASCHRRRGWGGGARRGGEDGGGSAVAIVSGGNLDGTELRGSSRPRPLPQDPLRTA